MSMSLLIGTTGEGTWTWMSTIFLIVGLFLSTQTRCSFPALNSFATATYILWFLSSFSTVEASTAADNVSSIPFWLLLPPDKCNLPLLPELATDFHLSIWKEEGWLMGSPKPWPTQCFESRLWWLFCFLFLIRKESLLALVSCKKMEATKSRIYPFHIVLLYAYTYIRILLVVVVMLWSRREASTIGQIILLNTFLFVLLLSG